MSVNPYSFAASATNISLLVAIPLAHFFISHVHLDALGFHEPRQEADDCDPCGPGVVRQNAHEPVEGVVRQVPEEVPLKTAAERSRLNVRFSDRHDQAGDLLRHQAGRCVSGDPEGLWPRAHEFIPRSDRLIRRGT